MLLNSRDDTNLVAFPSSDLCNRPSMLHVRKDWENFSEKCSFSWIIHVLFASYLFIFDGNTLNLQPGMLSVLCHVHSLRFAVPAAVMMGVAPQYLSMWMAWRILSSVLPRRIYNRGDEYLYDMYQSLVCFFFETYTGAEVEFFCVIM